MTEQDEPRTDEAEAELEREDAPSDAEPWAKTSSGDADSVTDDH